MDFMSTSGGQSVELIDTTEREVKPKKTIREKLKTFFGKLFIRKRLSMLEQKYDALDLMTSSTLDNIMHSNRDHNSNFSQQLAEIKNKIGYREYNEKSSPFFINDGLSAMLILHLENKTNKKLKNIEVLKPIRFLKMEGNDIITKTYSLKNGISSISLCETFSLLSLSRHTIGVTRYVSSEKQRKESQIKITTTDVFGRAKIQLIQPMIDNYQFQLNQVDIKRDFDILPNTSIILTDLLPKEKVSFYLFPKSSIHFTEF